MLLLYRHRRKMKKIMNRFTVTPLQSMENRFCLTSSYCGIQSIHSSKIIVALLSFGLFHSLPTRKNCHFNRNTLELFDSQDIYFHARTWIWWFFIITHWNADAYLSWLTLSSYSGSSINNRAEVICMSSNCVWSHAQKWPPMDSYSKESSFVYIPSNIRTFCHTFIQIQTKFDSILNLIKCQHPTSSVFLTFISRRRKAHEM
mmetsp:Transcript_26636/g.54982  ORF Transcript_26636/g.54982 Transcript_26636/m.54982 type:complete len:202 (-) Transcript_26636:524-1129(-)